MTQRSLRGQALSGRYRRDKKPNCSRSSQACGKICIPKKKTCRIGQKSLGLSAPKRKFQSGYEATLKAEEDKIRKLDYERAIGVDMDGKVIFNRGGDKSHVALTWDDVAKLKGNIITHNHPTHKEFPEGDPRRIGNTFSEDDVRLFCLAKVKEGRAVTDGKYDYSMKPPKDKEWNAWFHATRVNPSFKKHQQQVAVEYMTLINWNRMTLPQAEAKFQHEIWTRVAKDTGIQYTRIKRSEK